MNSFEELKQTLPAKWLEYYKINQVWIKSLMDSKNWWRKTPEDGQRPSADIILDTITALEPKLAVWIVPFCELNFDPQKAIDKQTQKLDSDRPFTDPELEKLRQEIKKQENSNL